MSTPRTNRSSKRVRKRGVATPSPRQRGRLSTTAENRKLAALVKQHFRDQGRAERIARAQEAWRVIERVGSTFKKIDADTIKWIAESPDLEYF